MTISKGAAVLMTIALAIAAYWVLPHTDFPDYGKFADDSLSPFHTRNVLSNLGLLIAGIAGVWSSRRLGDDSLAALTLFAGVIATAFGSAWFHFDPLAGDQLNRFTLFWDRAPMTIAFAGLLALVLHDRVFHRTTRLALPLLAITGIATTLHWYFSGDLYPYAFFQFYAAMGTLLMILTLRPSYTESGYVVAAVVLFGASKLFEDLDWEIFREWGIGGHPLKHIASAIAALMILLWLMKRRPAA